MRQGREREILRERERNCDKGEKEKSKRERETVNERERKESEGECKRKESGRIKRCDKGGTWGEGNERERERGNI